MSESLPASSPPQTQAKGSALIAWIVIVLSVAAILGGRAWMEQASDDRGDTADSRNRDVVLELQSRYLIGAHHLLAPFGQGLGGEVEKMNHGSVEQRLRIITLIGETAGPAEALKHLDEFDRLRGKHLVALKAPQERARAILRSAYRDFEKGKLDAPSVNAGDRAFLVEELGWFGTLALHPNTNQDPPPPGREEAIWPAQVTVLAVFGAIAAACFFICVGIGGIITFAVMAWNGSLIWRFQAGMRPPVHSDAESFALPETSQALQAQTTPHGNVYAEAFALWLVCFFGCNVGISLLPIDIPRMTQAILAFLASLTTLAWPVARGIPWRQVRDEVGLVCPGNPLTEIAAGVWCYIVNLPLVAIGFAITLGLLLLQAKLNTPEGGNSESFANEPLPSHPILQFLTDGDWLMRAQIFLLACVVAPLVEETMFRGVLHRHCRELTRTWRPIVSALFSTTVVSFLFAAVHPQGLMVIPVLMFMAYGFSLAREWRVSLLPSMFAHGMSNGIVLTVATIALSK